MKNFLLIFLLLLSFSIFSQDMEETEEVDNPDVEVVEEAAADSEVIEETVPVEEAPLLDDVVEEEIIPDEPVEEVMETMNSADIKAKFRNIKTLKSTQEEEVKIDIRKPDDSSIMPRKKTDFEYLQKREMEEKLKKSNKMLY